MAKLYTHTGDTGMTSLIGGERVSKCDLRVVASGDLDELNAHVGMLDSLVNDSELHSQLVDIQTLLFHAGTWLSAQSSNGMLCVSHESTEVSAEDIEKIELWIDKLQRETPQPHTFVLPGGTVPSSQSHVCRAVARRAERSIVAMSKHVFVAPYILRLVNRLSDYFFAVSLKLNFISHKEEKKLYISCK